MSRSCACIKNLKLKVSADQRARLLMSTQRLNQSSDKIKVPNNKINAKARAMVACGGGVGIFRAAVPKPFCIEMETKDQDCHTKNKYHFLMSSSTYFQNNFRPI